MRALFILVFCSSCIAGSVKGRIGLVADGQARGVQVGASFGFGYAGRRSAVVETVGFATGTAPYVGLDIGLDYVRVPEDGYGKVPLGWRVGLGGVPIAYGRPAIMGGRLAALWVMRDRTRSSGHEKFGSSSTRSLHAVGIEALVGGSVYDEDAGPGGSLSLTYEWYMLSRGF